VQVVGTAGSLQVAGLDELVGHGDDIGGLAVRVQQRIASKISSCFGT
jgi:hypothetical protein